MRQDWSNWGSTRLAGQWNQFYLDLVDYDEGEGVGAASVYVDNRFSLAKRVTLTHMATAYFWRDGSGTGLDSEAELSFQEDGTVAKAAAWGLRRAKRDP